MKLEIQLIKTMRNESGIAGYQGQIIQVDKEIPTGLI